eukprot:660198-Rhodomonas_salina.1
MGVTKRARQMPRGNRTPFLTKERKVQEEAKAERNTNKKKRQEVRGVGEEVEGEGHALVGINT